MKRSIVSIIILALSLLLLTPAAAQHEDPPAYLVGVDGFVRRQLRDRHQHRCVGTGTCLNHPKSYNTSLVAQ